MNKHDSMLRQSLGLLAALATANVSYGQIQGPGTGSTPYLLPTHPGFETTSLLTVDNTGATADDLVAKTGGGTYGMTGIPDGLGAFDNGDGTFTVLMNQELGNTLGVVRDHGSKGAFVTKWVINRETLAVVSGEDLMKQVFGWNSTTQSSNAAPGTVAFNRFCSADLPAVTAFYNPASGLGSQARIFMHGEEGSATGWLQGTVVTGPNAGKSYTLGKFCLTTNNSGLTGVGAWENSLANPFPQDKTVVIGNNDGGTGIMTNALSVYVGTKQANGTEVEKAGLMNGTLKHVLVTGNPVEITNTTTRVTGITSGTRFSLSATASTTFSRPEDGAWDPLNPSCFYFVTTDRLDNVSDGLGAQVGRTRLWRLTFDDITNPDAGGRIDLLIDGRVVDGELVNMFDNLTVNGTTGHLLLQEDVGGAAHNGKIWDYDPATDVLKKVAKHDPSRFGDLTTAPTAPYNNDEESSGIIDITPIMAGSTRHKGITNEAWYLTSDQAHYTSATPGSTITPAQVEGGQLVLIHDISSSAANVAITRGEIGRGRSTNQNNPAGQGKGKRNDDHPSGNFFQDVTITNNAAGPISGPFYLVLDGLSANATLFDSTGVTSVYPPLGSPYVTIPGTTLAPGASATVSLKFGNATTGDITYTARVLNSIPTP